jgi:SAM-dependent methyltransferase
MNDPTEALQQSYDSIAEEYARRIYDELGHKPLDRALLDYVAEVMQGRGTVADIGCGPGHVGRYLFDRGLPVVGVDLSPAMVRMATELNPGMTFRQGTMLKLDVEDEEWAAIIAFYSIIHIPPDELPRVFREFHRVLSPGGFLLLAFHMGTKHVHLDEWWGHEVDVNTYFFEREAVERLLEEARFAVDAHMERRPDEAVEYPSNRAYIIARKLNGGAAGEAV